ncbi:MAG: dihydropteroate synthase, partial [Steroidobacteraceae bacterium]
AEVRAFLDERVLACRAAGFASEQLLIDPGFGFGKAFAHNLTLLRRLSELTRADVPLLVGLSRKALLGKLTGRAAGERVYGSVALAVIAAERGARIIRAHDVAATVDALKVIAALDEGG